jgi:hypothetical protein
LEQLIGDEVRNLRTAAEKKKKQALHNEVDEPLIQKISPNRLRNQISFMSTFIALLTVTPLGPFWPDVRCVSE